jgi:hypothetical protein
VRQKLKEIAIKICTVAIRAKFAYGPIYVPTTRDPLLLEPVWMKSVTHRYDPDGVRFFLRCHDGETDYQLGDARPVVKVRVLDYQMIVRERGRYVYRKQASEDDKDYSKPEHTPRSRIGALGGDAAVRRPGLGHAVGENVSDPARGLGPDEPSRQGEV